MIEKVIRLDDDVDRLYTAVKLYLTQISREALDETGQPPLGEIISLTINLEHVGDILERVMLELRDKKIAQRLSFSDAGMREITELHGKLIENLRLGLSVFLNGDVKSAQRLLSEKERFRDLERAYHDSHLEPPRRASRCRPSRPARCTWTSSATCGASIPSSARPPTRSSSRRDSCGRAGSWA
jgi:phosphate:Na+ symporter